MVNLFLIEIKNEFGSYLLIKAPIYLNINNVRLFIDNMNFRKQRHEVSRIFLNEKETGLYYIKNLYEYYSYYDFYRNDYEWYNYFYDDGNYPRENLSPHKNSFKHLTDELADYFIKKWPKYFSKYEIHFKENFKKYRDEMIIKDIVK